VVVLGLVALVVVAGVILSLVGAVRSPDDVSRSATILGTFPADPEAPGIVAPTTATTLPPGAGSPPATVSGPTPEVPSGGGNGREAFDEGTLATLDLSGGEWQVVDGSLVAPAASGSAPALALLDDVSTNGIGAEVGSAPPGAGLVAGLVGPDTHVAAVVAPEGGAWRLEVRVEGEVVEETTVPAPTAAGTTVVLVVADGSARLTIDGAELAVVDAASEALGQRAGFISESESGARWTAQLGLEG